MISFIMRLFKKIKGVYYIQKKMFLPEPLNDEEERILLLKCLNENDINSRNILIERNMRLVVFIAKRFEGSRVPIEDLISIGSLGLIKGINTFKLDKNIKLATYASRCIENEILMYLRKISKQSIEVSLDETLNVDRDGNELLLSDVISVDESDFLEQAIEVEKEKILYKSLDDLKPREKEIIALRFGLYNKEALTQKEVAEFLGISQSYISRLEKRIIDKLRFEMTNRMGATKKNKI